MPGHQLNFPSLPVHPMGSATSWPSSVYPAYRSIQAACNQAYRLAGLHNGDTARISIQLGILRDECLPVLAHLESLGLPFEFIDSVMNQMAICHVELEQALANMQDHPSAPTGVFYIEAIQHSNGPSRGRPRKEINPDILREAFSGSRNITVTELAKALEVSWPTLYKNLELHGIQPNQFENISSEDLDLLIEDFKAERPSSGYRMAMAHLRQNDLRVQRDRVLESMQKVDRLGIKQRTSQPIPRRVYSSPRPNFLWHHDGHHKLGPFGFVIHGFIDGYDHMIVGMRASDNNRSATVLQLFLDSTQMHGTPSRCRGDRGGENLGVATYMTLVRGENRASYMWGSSTHNQRIERLWHDAGMGFGRPWKAFLIRLEDRHCLDQSNPHHLWLLHDEFIVELNQDVDQFVADWNTHGISGSATKGKSPQDMRFLGQLTQGLQEDIYADVPPEVLQEFLGVDLSDGDAHAGVNTADDSDDETEAGAGQDTSGKTPGSNLL
ncbi:hypothetical protein FRC09_016995 [Ceratobasidium sp. 395]|nr:hypothetical protein FRC09_016995 [Ceratobasidium sp. 395]